MSSTAVRSGASPAPAPWRSSFLSHLSKMDSPEFVLSTVAAAPPNSTTPYVPRARYCIYRGMWSELPENKHNDAPKNARIFESDCPTFTSDTRMEKIPELFGSSAGHATSREQTTGSGGGGPVEAVWWIKGDTMVQWRIKGEAFVVGPDIEGTDTESSGVRTVKSELGKRMRQVAEGEWSWQTELTGHFGNCSPGMRGTRDTTSLLLDDVLTLAIGTFKQPPPGQPVSEPYNDKDCKMGEKVTDLHEDVSRRNFRVVVIRPEEVESVDLSDPSKARRQRYHYNSSSGEWTHEETWP